LHKKDNVVWGFVNARSQTYINFIYIVTASVTLSQMQLHETRKENP